MTVTGKIRKVQMRTEAIDILGLSEAAKTETA
jgi:fatty-acyl-CoA synthase